MCSFESKQFNSNPFIFQQSVLILDPSDIYRPDISSYAQKDVKDFRDYTVTENDPLKERVFQTYKAMHTNQTVDFVEGMDYSICSICFKNIAETF